MLSQSIMSDSLQSHELWPTRLFCPWDSLGMNTGMSWHFLLQGTCPSQGLNSDSLCLPHWQADSLLTEPSGIYLWACVHYSHTAVGQGFNTGIWGRRWEHNSVEKKTQPHPWLTRGSGRYYASAAEFGCDTDQHICTAWNVPQAALHRSLLTPGLEQGSCCVYRVTSILIVPETHHQKTPE